MKHALLIAVGALVAAICTATPATAASVCADGGVTSYPPPPASDGPFGVTAGPGGTWYSEGDRIVRVRANGVLDQFVLPDPDIADAGWLSWQGGHVVWFSDRGTGRLGTVDGHGHVVEYQVPPTPDGSGASPNGQVILDGIVWFTDPPTNRIGRLDPATGHITVFSVPTADSWPLGITAAPDGTLYFVERDANKVGRMTPSGAFTEWALTGSGPQRITLGTDGNIWFTELRSGQLGRIDAGGTLTETSIDGGPVGITVGPDGNLYVALWFSHQLGRVDATGHLTRTWDVPGALQVAASHGDFWLTDAFANSVSSVHITCME